MLLGFVPARGGSKGIPRKNLVALAGKPLIQYTLEAAHASARIDDILLSTDDEEIAAFCARFGVATGYRRPPELSRDDAPMIAAVDHGLEWYARECGRKPDEVLVLQPTSPLRTAQDIDGAVGRFRENAADTLASVHPLAEHPCECVLTQGDGWQYLVPPSTATRRQDYLGKYYFINGAVYLARTRVLLKERRFVVPGATLLYEMPRERGIDIDSLLDLAYAEALLGMRQANA
jgi:N-acylneuraminate cytidylyltransferase/CMP-N,N'-diacetyllegionaminic acid synthase